MAVAKHQKGDRYRYGANGPRRFDCSGYLMFFNRRGNVYHVGIFTGRTRSGRAVMVHAPGSGRRVQSSVAWTPRWFAGTLRRR